MARPASRDTQPHDSEISVPEIVFACGICQATITEVYKEKESNLGFSSGPGSEDGIVTKFWIAECAHAFCGKHLEGGAAPIHPEGLMPRTACPVCAQYHSNNAHRNLYGMRGLEAGQYDASIPQSFFSCPPIRMDVDDPGSDGLRFQYSGLVRYARQITKKFRAAESNRRAIEKALTKERKHWCKKDEQLQALHAHGAETDAKLQKWEARKDKIKQSLDSVVEMAKDIHSMRNKLVELGYTIPEKRYGHWPRLPQTRPESATLRNAQNESSNTLVDETHQSSSPRKRKLTDHDPYTEGRPQPQPIHLSSRELMPPPQPRPRQAQRRPGTHLQSQSQLRRDSVPQQRPQPPQEVQTFNNGAWNQTKQSPGEQEPRSDMEHTQHGKVRGGVLPQQLLQMSLTSTDDVTPIHDENWDLPNEDYEPETISYIRPQRVGLMAEPPRRRAQPRHHVLSNSQNQDELSNTDPYHYRALSKIVECGQDTRDYRSQVRELDHHMQSYQDFEAPPPSSILPANTRNLPFNHTPSNRRVGQPPTQSVTSPFFGSQQTVSQHGAMRSRPRGAALPLQSRYAPSPRDAIRVDSMASTRGSIDGPYYSNLNSGSINHPRLSAFEFLRQNFAAPSTTTIYPHSYQPTSGALRSTTQRGQMPPPSSAGPYTHAPTQSPSRLFTHRSRMTLPPTKSRGMHFSSRPDPQLAMINGVRGAGPRSQYVGQTPAGPFSQAPRSLYSASGSMRAVRR